MADRIQEVLAGSDLAHPACIYTWDQVPVMPGLEGSGAIRAGHLQGRGSLCAESAQTSALATSWLNHAVRQRLRSHTQRLVRDTSSANSDPRSHDASKLINCFRRKLISRARRVPRESKAPEPTYVLIDIPLT